MVSRRRACLFISYDLMDEIIKSAFSSFNARKTGECHSCYLYRLGLDNLEAVLGFPEEVRIVSLSAEALFSRQSVAFTLDSPDFCEVPEASLIPEVQAVYDKNGFSYWQGDGALVGTYIKHSERPGYSPRHRWWLRAGEDGTWRDKPPLL